MPFGFWHHQIRARFTFMFTLFICMLITEEVSSQQVNISPINFKESGVPYSRKRVYIYLTNLDAFSDAYCAVEWASPYIYSYYLRDRVLFPNSSTVLEVDVLFPQAGTTSKDYITIMHGSKSMSNITTVNFELTGIDNLTPCDVAKDEEIILTNYLSTNRSEYKFAKKLIRLVNGFHFKAENNKTFFAEIIHCPNTKANFIDTLDTSDKICDNDLAHNKITTYFSGNILTVKAESFLESADQIEIYNMSGVLVHKSKTPNIVEHFDMYNCPNGVYIIRLQYKTGRVVSKKALFSR